MQNSRRTGKTYLVVVRKLFLSPFFVILFCCCCWWKQERKAKSAFKQRMQFLSAMKSSAAARMWKCKIFLNSSSRYHDGIMSKPRERGSDDDGCKASRFVWLSTEELLRNYRAFRFKTREICSEPLLSTSHRAMIFLPFFSASERVNLKTNLPQHRAEINKEIRKRGQKIPNICYVSGSSGARRGGLSRINFPPTQLFISEHLREIKFLYHEKKCLCNRVRGKMCRWLLVSSLV